MPRRSPRRLPAPLWVRALRPLPFVGRRARRWPARLIGAVAGRDDDDGPAGVREPRRPKPAPPSLSVHLDEPVG